MENEIETITIRCPICSSDHSYRISVTKSHIIYNVLTTRTSMEKQFKRFRRVFTCFIKGEQFEATLKLEEGFGTIIHDVHVKGN